MWVYAHNGQKVGPVTFEEIVNQIQAGVIVPNTPVCSSGEKPCRAGHHPKLQPYFTANKDASAKQKISTPIVANSMSENQVPSIPQFALPDSSPRQKKSKHRVNKKSKNKNDQFNLMILTGIVVVCVIFLGIFLLSSKSSRVADSSSETLNTESSDSFSSQSLSKESTQPQSLIRLSKQVTAAGEREVITINGVGFAFRWCPAGTFMMGSPEDEKDRKDNETQHQVTLTKGFWMLETEVTQMQWKAVMGSNPSDFKGDDLPVEKVSWDDCQEFCKKCSKLGFPVQLPTEAEWEYACRAGATGTYAGELDAMAWYGYYHTPKGTSKDATTHPVGTKKPNAWGLYDMHGNVCEWCQDWYEEDYPSGSVTDPMGSSNASFCVIRGGCWNSYAKYCRSAFRGYSDPSTWDGSLGFRVVKGQ